MGGSAFACIGLFIEVGYGGFNSHSNLCSISGVLIEKGGERWQIS